jgi:hypothetical protein
MMAPMSQDHNVATVPNDDFVSVRALYDDHQSQMVVVAVDTPGSASEGTKGALYPYTPAIPAFTAETAVDALPDFYNGDTRDIGFLPGMTQTSFSHFRQLITEKWGVIVNRERWAGLTSPLIAFVTSDTTSDWLLAGNAVSYRANYTLEYTVAGQNYIVNGPPSSISSYFNDGGTDISTTLALCTPKDEPTLHYGLMTGYKLYFNLYRTKQDTVTTVQDLPDEFRRVAKILITSLTDVSISWDDTVTEEAAAGGEPLYTNPGEEGEDQASYAPPVSRDVCVFKDTTFYANRSGFPALKLFIPGAFGELITDEERTYGIGSRTATFAAITGPGPGPTPGSLVIVLANASDAIGLVPGQQLIDTINFAAGTYIVSVAGLNVTMSSPALHSVNPYTVSFWDMMTVKQTFSNAATTTISGRVTAFDLDTINSSTRAFRLLHEQFDPRRNVPSMELTATNIYPACDRCISFEVYVTNGQNYSPAYTGDYVTLTNPLVSLGETRPNLVFCSKTGEPEAVPLANQFQIGAGTIYKMWANQSAIFFFCSDGLWKMTGDQVSNFQVSQVDPTVFLIHPDCVTSLNNQIYAWITDGVALVTEDGAKTISTDAIGPEIREIAGQLSRSLWGPCMSADNFYNEVWVNARVINNELENGGWLQTWVYNDDTKNFSTQDHLYISMAYLPVASRMAFVFDDTSEVDSTFVQVQSDYDTFYYGVVVRACEVWFNPLQTDDKGNLKQWMDLYFFVTDYVAGGESDFIKALFDSRGTRTDDTADTVNIRDMAVIRRDLHYWCPRRAASGDQIQVGFRSLPTDDDVNDTAFSFQFQGFKLRYRVASDTLKR